MPPPEARMRHRSSKYVSTARPSLEVRSVMALHWSWKEVRRRIVPAGAGVCKIARMSLPVPLVRAVALPIPLLSIRFQLRCIAGTAGGPRRIAGSLACYSSGTCQAAWPSVSAFRSASAPGGLPVGLGAGFAPRLAGNRWRTVLALAKQLGLLSLFLSVAPPVFPALRGPVPGPFV